MFLNPSRIRRACVPACIAGTLAVVSLAVPATILVAAAPAQGAPEPLPVPRRWQLDVEVGPLRMVKIDGREYLYLTYKVVNNSGEDLLFAPSFELATDEGHVMRSGRGVPVSVTRQVMEMLENPFLEDQIAILGMLLQGEENAKEGVVIWPANGLDVDEISIYAAGFSGETATLELPATGTTTPKASGTPRAQTKGEQPAVERAAEAPATGATTRIHAAPAEDPAATGEDAVKKVVLRKTLMLRYRIPGELTGRGSVAFSPHERRWIMR